MPLLKRNDKIINTNYNGHNLQSFQGKQLTAVAEMFTDQ